MYKALDVNYISTNSSKPVSFNGIGLHTGKNCNLKIYPAKEDTGIVFKRVDLSKII